MRSETKSHVDQITSPAGHPVSVLRFEGDIASTSREAVLGTYQGPPKQSTKVILLAFPKVEYMNSAASRSLSSCWSKRLTRGRKCSPAGFRKRELAVAVLDHAVWREGQPRQTRGNISLEAKGFPEISGTSGMQYRRLSFGCPGEAAVGSLAQSTFVDEDEGPAFLLGFF